MEENFQTTVDSRRLVEAIALADFELVARLISMQVDENGSIEIARGLDTIDQMTGETPLTQAVLIGDLRIAKFLLGRWAGVNISRRDGDMPLILAIREGDADMIALLVSRNADTRIRDAAGRTAHDVAESLGDPQITALLRTRIDEHNRYRSILLSCLAIAGPLGDIEADLLLALAAGAWINPVSPPIKTQVVQRNCVTQSSLNAEYGYGVEGYDRLLARLNEFLEDLIQFVSVNHGPFHYTTYLSSSEAEFIGCIRSTRLSQR